MLPEESECGIFFVQSKKERFCHENESKKNDTNRWSSCHVDDRKL